MASLRYFESIKYGQYADLRVAVDPDSRELWITYPTMEVLFDWRSNSAREKLTSKSLKALAGNDLALGKTITAKDILARPNKFKAILFDSFLKVLYWQFKEGNPSAERLVMAGFADSFSSLVLEQCGVQVTTEERQQVISFYLSEYHDFMDWIRDRYLKLNGVKPESGYYAKINFLMDCHLCGVGHFNGNRKKYATNAQLRRLENYQMMIMERVSKYPNLEPIECIETILALLEGHSS